MFFPNKKTWIKYIKNNFFSTWTGLSVELVTKYSPTSIFTAKCHFRQLYKGTSWTKQYVLVIKPLPEKLDNL